MVCGSEEMAEFWTEVEKARSFHLVAASSDASGGQENPKMAAIFNGYAGFWPNIHSSQTSCG